MRQKHSDGLSFKHIDLHVHTPASKDFVDKTVSPEQLVQAAIDKGLDAIAITDHNSSEWIDKVNDAAKGTSLAVFPGVEITCTGGNGGIHVVAIFEKGSPKSLVDHLLSKLDILPVNRGDLDYVVNKTVQDVIKEIRNAGGLAVLAHANSTSGVVNEIRGQERIGILTDKLLNAVEATDCMDNRKASQKARIIDHLDGSNNNYKNRTLAVYQASDNPNGSGAGRTGHGIEGIASRSTYFKMDTICLEALRQCFSDPKVRIRFTDDSQVYPYIKSISVEGGYFDKKSTSLHQGLNTILGGKGAGKSLLIELLRFTLNQPSSVDAVLKDYSTKLEKRLENYGRVSATIVDQDGVERTIVRSYKPSEDNPYEDEDMLKITGEFPVLFLSQNEIISIAEDESAQLAFIDKFFNFRHHKLVISDLEAQLGEWDRRLAEGIEASKEVGEVRRLLASTKTEIATLDKQLENPIFAELKIQEAKKIALEARDEELQELELQANSYLKSDELEFFSADGMPDEVSKDPLVKRLSDIDSSVKAEIKSKIGDVIDTIRKARGEIEAETEKFTSVYANAKQKYEEQVREGGGDAKVLAERRSQKAKEIDNLQAREKRLAVRSKDIRQIAQDRKNILVKLQNAYSEYAKERKAKLKTIEASSSSRLRLDISEGSNNDAFTARLRELKRGTYLKDYEIDQITNSINPFEFINNVLYYVISDDVKYVGIIAEQVEIDQAKVKQLIDFLVTNYSYDTLLQMQYKVVPEDTPSIEYNISDNPAKPVYRNLAELSTGQKCTAMLIIALSDGNQPIVIDQPEDSLDIKSVWVDMCKRLRKEKIRRQFVFTTHNSSLAVASDTDRYLIIEGGANNGEFVASGSMDEPEMNSEVIKYLEGDLDAYNLKAEKYKLNG